jgi:hypothetical protein
MTRKSIFNLALIYFATNMVFFSAFADEILLDKSAKIKDFYIIDLNQIDVFQKILNNDTVHLKDRNTRLILGTLKKSNREITLEGNNAHFLIASLPSNNNISLLTIQSCESLIFEAFMDLPYPLILRAKGRIQFRNTGAKLNNYVEISGAKELRIEGNLSINGFLKLDNIKIIQILKAAHLNADYLQISGDVDPTIQNMGTLHVKKDLDAKGAWYNNSGGKVIVGEYFGGKFSNYFEDGETTVHGLACINAKNGRMTNKFSASYGIITFEANLDIASTSSFYAQHNLTFLSQNSINLHSKNINLNPKNQIFNNTMSRDLFNKIRNIDNGIFISAKKNLNTTDANFKSANTKISLSSKNFTQKGGTISTGVFDNNQVSISATKTASLQGDINAHMDSFIRAKTIELKGTRQIGGVLFLGAENIDQKPEDINKAHSVVAKTNKISLGGKTELRDGGIMSLNIKNDFETKNSCKIENGKISVQCENAQIVGALKNTSLAMDASKKITLEKGLDAELNESNIRAKKITHEKKSKLKVLNTNIEIAKKGIKIKHGAKIEAEDNLLKTTNTLGYILNSGSIKSNNTYSVDTGFNIDFLSSVKAQRAIINADFLNFACLSSLRAKDVEINTLVNIGLLNHLKGTNSVQINALIANLSLLNITSSNNLSVNSIFNVNYGLNLPGQFTGLGNIGLASIINTGFGLATTLASGPALGYVQAVKSAWSIASLTYGLCGNACQIWATAKNMNKEDFLRPSRIAKLAGPCIKFGLGANNLCSMTSDFLAQTTNISEAISDNSNTIIADQTKLDSSNRSWIFDVIDIVADNLPMSTNINSVFHHDQGCNIMPHMNINSYYLNDRSYNVCLNRSVHTYTGADNSSGMFYKNHVASVDDLAIGKQKDVLSTNKFDVGKNAILEEDFLSNASNTSVKAGGTMHVKDGANALGGEASFTSKGEMDFKGQASQEKSIFIASLEGKTFIDKSAALKTDKNGKVEVYGQTTVQKENGSTVDSGDVTYYGQEHTIVDGKTAAGGNVFVISDGNVTEKSTSSINAEGIVNIKAKGHLSTETGARADGKNVRRHGESNDAFGISNATENASTTSKTGTLNIGSHLDQNAPNHVIGSGYDQNGNKIPLEQSGLVNIEPGASVKGENLALNGKGIEDIANLHTQTGKFSNFKITNSVEVTTDQSVLFPQSAKSAAASFALRTDQIKTNPDVHLSADKMMVLNSESKLLPMELGVGTVIKSGVYTEVTSNNDIKCGFEKIITRDKYGRPIDVDYKTVMLEGGTGIEYEFTDPETGEKSIRNIGLVVDAKNKLDSTGLVLAAGSDIYARGEKFTNMADGQVCVSQKPIKKDKVKEDKKDKKGKKNKENKKDKKNKESKKSKNNNQQEEAKETKIENKWYGTKTTEYYHTEYLVPIVDTPGKFFLNVGKSGLDWQAGILNLGEGGIIWGGPIRFWTLEGKEGRITYTDSPIPGLSNKNKKIDELSTTTEVINQGTSMVSILAVDEEGNRYPIYAPGLVYNGLQGTLKLAGKWGYFSQEKLKNKNYSNSVHPSFDKSIKPFSNLKKSYYHAKQGNWKEAAQKFLDPSIRINLDFQSNQAKGQVLGNGGIATNKIIIDFTGDFTQNNGYSIYAPGGGEVKIGGKWIQNGAKLKYSEKSKNIGGFLDVNTNGPHVGVKVGYGETKGHTWVPVNNYFGGTTNFNVNKVVQNAAYMDVENGTGNIDIVESTTRKNKRKTGGISAAIKVGLSGDVKASTNAHYHEKHETNHESGITFGGASDVKIREAHLKGAKIEGAIPEKTSYTRISRNKDRGFSFGLAGNNDGLKTVHGSISNRGREYSVSIPTQKPSDSENKFVKSFGTFGYQDHNRNIHLKNIPIVYDVNFESLHKLTQNLKKFTSKYPSENIKYAGNSGTYLETQTEENQEISECVVNSDMYFQPQAAEKQDTKQDTIDDHSESSSPYSVASENGLKKTIKWGITKCAETVTIVTTGSKIPLPLRAASFLFGLIEQVDNQDIVDAQNAMDDAEKNVDPGAYFQAQAKRDFLLELKGLKYVLDAPGVAADWCFEKFDEQFPSVNPKVAELIQNMHADTLKLLEEATREGSPLQQAFIQHNNFP